MKLVLAMILMAGCGAVVEPVPTAETSAPSASRPLCGEMSCGVVACFACPDCEGARPLCYCGLSDDPAYQSDKPIACACWERIPDDFHGQTGCSYTPAGD